ncbi:HEAT repeat domain-containing protein [Sphingomonas lycopersici]|uniref:HEAT repeat domain-containing protein n=1 Tax=Sphingomonas lycopersici TaxID=2951807 RepID=A0AA41ZB90_9SPHN|nr:HEAT repeat domain-containing protein [Sphingomonas lycopersici]MCW6533709.1 HEAT repeat domain-containing protein [Sphingomonas lycopersici]
MHWPTIADHAARVAIVISSVGALVMAVALTFLIIRRDRKERRLATAQATMRALTREIMASLPGGETGEIFAHASDSDRLAAIAHLGQLVRGEDRARLTEFVEENHLLDRIAADARQGSDARRVDAMRQLGVIGGPRAVETLLAILNEDPHLSVRLEAAAMLAPLGALPSPRRLIAALGLEHNLVTRLHRAFFRALAPVHAAELLSLLREDRPPLLRALIVDALGWTEDRAALAALERAADDIDPEVRCAALRAAHQINDPATIPWVMRLLRDASDAVRSNAVRAAAHVAPRQSLPQLETMRGDPSAWVRIRVAEALGPLASAA